VENSNTLVVNGRGGMPQEPQQPLGADLFNLSSHTKLISWLRQAKAFA
jgi:hypothetical protein